MVHVRAPGKINLALSVGPKGADGYHELATVFQAVSLYEEVYAHAAREFSVEFTGPIDTSGLTGDDTLVHRAARLVAAELSDEQRERLGLAVGQQPGIRIVVEKHVPIAGGMGGGSADAAATLLACDAVWGTNLSRARLGELAAQLGADVPFALTGGTALGVGRGDVLSPVLTSGEFAWVLVPDAGGLSTPAVYAELDRLREEGIEPTPTEPQVEADLFTALRQGSVGRLMVLLENDLQAAAFSLNPKLRDTANWIANRANSGCNIVSGSGPTIAVLTEDRGCSFGLARDIRAGGHQAIAVQGPVPGAHFVHDTPADELTVVQ